LKNILHTFSVRKEIEPPVFNTIANQSEGVVELYLGIQNQINTMKEMGLFDKRRLNRYRNRVSDLIRERLETKFWTKENKIFLDQTTLSLTAIKSAPIMIAKQLLEGSSHESI
jgi:putative protein kinase ArgK-like GTPase of G3E family